MMIYNFMFFANFIPYLKYYEMYFLLNIDRKVDR